MGITIEKIRRDFTRHRRKTAVLAVLALVMIGLFVKAGLEMRPRAAVGETSAVGAGATLTGEAPADSEEKIHQSEELWKVLREARGGLDAETAFTFDPSFFPVDPNKPEAPERVETLEHAAPAAPNTEALERSARVESIRAQARGLIVHSTVVGSGNSRPIAVVNQHILTTGDRIAGFEIMAIRAREVEFKKDGITLSVKMADDSPGQ